MRKPNQLLKKKYVSSLVIAAFMILTMLTAYNIRIGKEDIETEKTEVKETIGDSDVIISSGKTDSEDMDNNITGNNANNDTTNKVKGSDETNNDIEDNNAEDKNVTENATEDKLTDNNTEENSTESRNMQNDLAGDSAEENDITEIYTYDGKEKLSWPLMGNVILPYSMDTTVYYTTLDQYACNDGILISAKKGSPVTAVADGRIVNIYQSDKYGTTITLLIGKKYEVYYSQVENIQYEVGDEVKSGDMIASVAEPTRFFTLEGPHLYFKMTYEGEPVNPTDYLET